MQDKTQIFDKTVNSLFLDRVFTPNLTTKLSYEVAINNIKKNFKVLDLGCGKWNTWYFNKKKFKKVELFSSDVDQNAIKFAKKNFKKKIELKLTLEKVIFLRNGKK